MNLSDYPRLRKALYLVQFVVSGALLLIAVGFGAAQEELPKWYAITTAVTTALWTYLGLTAATNTPTPDDAGSADPLLVVIVMVWAALMVAAMLGVSGWVILAACVAFVSVLLCLPAARARMRQ